MNTTTRSTLTAAVAALIVSVAPAASFAADGDAKPMSNAEAYALTCGHLGVPCNPPRARHHARTRHHARGARHHVRHGR
jgi:hypothetical protein